MKRFLDFELRKESKLLPLALNQSFRGMAVSLLTLFSSVYIYQVMVGLTGRPKIGLLAAFIYYSSVYGFKFIANLFAEELSLRLGLKKQLFLGLVFFAVCLVLLYFSSSWPILIFFAGPFWGLSTGFYWFGSHGMMVKSGRDGHYGKESGLVNLVTTLPLAVIPFLGGAIIKLAGYHYLFGASLLFVLISAFCLLKMEEVKTRRDTNMSEVWSLFRTHKKVVLAYMGDTIAAAIYTMAIPLYLFLILRQELSMGGFFSLSMVTVALLNLFIGRWTDTRGNRGLIVYGAVVQAFAWLGRVFAKGVWELFALDITDRITDSMIAIPMQVLTYKKALDGQSTGRAVLFREQAITIGALTASLILIAWALLGLELRLVFFVGFLASFLPVLIVKNHDQKK